MKYTTANVLKKVQEDKTKTPEEVIEEQEKILISDDAYAICDFIEQLNKAIEHLRITSIMRR